jgi:hypothetical protein
MARLAPSTAGARNAVQACLLCGCVLMFSIGPTYCMYLYGVLCSTIILVAYDDQMDAGFVQPIL